jgi:hypothetical protein
LFHVGEIDPELRGLATRVDFGSVAFDTDTVTVTVSEIDPRAECTLIIESTRPACLSGPAIVEAKSPALISAGSELSLASRRLVQVSEVRLHGLVAEIFNASSFTMTIGVPEGLKPVPDKVTLDYEDKQVELQLLFRIISSPNQVREQMLNVRVFSGSVAIYQKV